MLLAIGAPAGWVTAGAPSERYVVLFSDDAVTVPDVDQPRAGTTASFLQLAAAHPLPQVSAVAGESDGVSNRRVDPDRVAQHIQDVTTRNGIGEIDDVYSAAVGGFSVRLTDAQRFALESDPSIAAVLPDEVVTLDDMASGIAGSVRTTAKPIDHLQPGVRRVGASGEKRVDADVAILDTGIQRDHPDLNVAGGYNCTGRNRDRWDDDEGHGTHVAGIVGALDNGYGVTGVAPGARLWSVKVLDDTGHGFISWLVCGVDWVTAQRDPHNSARPLFEVANMSLTFSLPGANDSDCGRTTGDSLHMAICRSVERGITYVVAAGNESAPVRRVRPAAYDEVITVSALADYDGKGGGHGYPAQSCPYWSPDRDDAFASFSNYGPDVDLIAPGKCILSTYLKGRYAWMSGTSMATPHVTGAVAIYKQKYPRATPEQVRMALEAVGTLDWRTGTDPDGVHEKAVWIGHFRAVPDFAMSASAGDGVAAQGSTLPLDIDLLRVGGFDAAVTLSVAHVPAGVSATPVVTKGNKARLVLRVGQNTRPGVYSVTVAAVTHDVVHSQAVTVVVRGNAPPPSQSRATFTAPATGLRIQPGTAVAVAWNERGGANITGRRLERQVGTIRTAGTCDGVNFATQASFANAHDMTDHVRSGYCYRWVLTLTDSTGNRSSATSGALLVDASAPRAPTVRLSASESRSPDRADLGIDASYVDGRGVIWVRTAKAGSVPLQVNSNDPESGIARNVATLRGRGWNLDWIGNAANGALRVNYSSPSPSATLTVASVNGAGISGANATVTLAADASAPTAARWVSAPSATTKHIRGAYFRLNWTTATDKGSGLAAQQIVGRYRAPLSANGTCRTNAFVPDGEFRLMRDNSWDSGLAANACYVWSLRTLDRVGNMSASVVSGYVITQR